MGSLITLENVSTKISCIDETQSNFLYGLVDIGSNGIRFSISDLALPKCRLLTCVYRERAGVSLCDALLEPVPGCKPSHFSSQTISQVSEILKRFKKICDGHGLPKENIHVVATEAMRTAVNQQEMFQAISKISDLTVDILSPGIESLFGAMGARSGFHQVDGLFMDLGGGSVQMTYLNTNLGPNYHILAAEAATSMPFGAAKLTPALKDPATAEAAKTKLHTDMKAAFKNLAQKFPSLKAQVDQNEGVTIYLCGGGFRGYGSILMFTDPIQPYPIPSIGGYTVSGERFVNWQQMLDANSCEGKIYGMSKRRREQFPATICVIEALVEAIPKDGGIPKVKSVTFCNGGNREGALFMKLPPEIRESDPFPLLPTPSQDQDPAILSSLVDLLITALPSSYPAIFTNNILYFIVRKIWSHQGLDDNSSRALHDCISGTLAGLPGLTHEIRAVLALILTARWGLDLALIDAQIVRNLQEIVRPEIAWWCQYIGMISCLLSEIFPVFPKSDELQGNPVQFEAISSDSLGKKGKKSGVVLIVSLNKDACEGIPDGSDHLKKLLKKVGKDLQLGWKLKVEIVIAK
ncbi:hypothetical protein K3495_g10643 [Podosphaera aphanis]|nr:hypothetical protein K3495_g10643 [Podosphaera aphanis]